MIDKVKRGNVVKEIRKLSELVNVESELQHVDLYKLLQVYQKVVQRYEIEKNKPTHTVQQYPYTIEGQKGFILEKIGRKGKVAFSSIIEFNPEKIAVIHNFLAILELLQLGFISLHLGEGFNNFWIENLDKELVN
jgi:segregation and condensation protein A